MDSVILVVKHHLSLADIQRLVSPQWHAKLSGVEGEPLLQQLDLSETECDRYVATVSEVPIYTVYNTYIRIENLPFDIHQVQFFSVQFIHDLAALNRLLSLVLPHVDGWVITDNDQIFHTTDYLARLAENSGWNWYVESPNIRWKGNR